MESVQAYVGLRGAANASELSDVPPERMALFTRIVPFCHEHAGPLIGYVARRPRFRWFHRAPRSFLTR